MKKKTVPPRKARRAPAAPKIPANLLPPSLTESFDGNPSNNHVFDGMFRAKRPIAYRTPMKGEYYWTSMGYVDRAGFNFEACERVILEPFPGAKRPGAQRRVPQSSSKKGSVQ